MKIYATRHAHTNYNQLHILNSDPGVDVHLTRKGVAQANRLALELKDAPIEHIVISGLPRTKQTAEIINQYHEVSFSVEPLFNDIRSGMEGWPVALWHARRYLHRNNPDVAFGNGESAADARARVVEGLKNLQKINMQNILVVAHRHTINVMQWHFKQQITNANNAEYHVFDV